MKKWVMIALALLSFGLASGHVVQAATSGTLTINKEATLNGQGTSQRTAPVAGAAYRIVRVVPSGQAPIKAQQPTTYRVWQGPGALNETLVTDADGFAQATGLALGAYFIVTELKNRAVPTPAAPQLIRFTQQVTQMTMTPKSNLRQPVPSQPSRHPGSSVPGRSQPTIAQTGGALTVPLLGWLSGLLAVLGVVAALAFYRRQHTGRID